MTLILTIQILEFFGVNDSTSSNDYSKFIEYVKDKEKELKQKDIQIQKKDEQFKQLEDRLAKNDSVIDNADKSELRDIINLRARRYDLHFNEFSASAIERR